MHSALLHFFTRRLPTHVVTDPKQQQSAPPVHVADATRCAIDRAGQLLHIGSNLVKVDKQSQAISPFGLPGGVHGLSAQIGALRPVLTATALAVCSRC